MSSHLNKRLNTLITIALFPRQNKLHVTEPAVGSAVVSVELVHQFSRRWECQILSMLLAEGQAGKALTKSALQETLRLKGQAKELNRAQLQRLFDSLNEFLDELPGKSFSLQIALRQMTVGPWKLVFAKPVSFHNAENGNQIDMPSLSWPYPSLLPLNEASFDNVVGLCFDSVHHVLSILLTSDAFALNGDFLEALDATQQIHHSPLTNEARCLVWLREALWQKRLGRFDLARKLASLVISNPPALDQGQVTYARFFLQRIDYDESPAKAHIDLWHSASSPEPTLQADWRLMHEWHNLRALMARRRLLELSKNANAVTEVTLEVSQKETPASLHTCALNHFQSAIYWALQQRNWDQLQAFSANVAFHLQEMVPLGFATVTQVYKWHGLVLDYADKLNLAQDSAWEYIFFSEFWLNHNKEIVMNSEMDPIAHSIDNFTPSHENFYLKGIEKLQRCADDRQVAIMWILYGRFAADHLKPHIDSEYDATADVKYSNAIKSVYDALASLMAKTPSLQTTLQEEGYAAYLPAA